MKIQKFSQIGKRSNNEDCLGLNEALITVCDGMGGHVSGERASSFVVDAMLKAFVKPENIGKVEIQKQLDNVHINMNKLLETEPELEKMGTTFTGIFITPDVWYAAHIGDSRIYMFRPSEKKLWHTWDHSLVGELMRTHEITCEGGRFHPMSNRISKAIIARKEGKPVGASIVKIDELKAGDVFLLCSDGVVEGWGDLELVNLFSDENKTFEEKCEILKKQCNENSKDNNTAIIVEIEEADAFAYGKNEELEWTSFAAIKDDYDAYMKEQEEEELGYSIEEESKPVDNVKPAAVGMASSQQQVPNTNVPKPESKAVVQNEQKKSSTKKIVISLVIICLLAFGATMLIRYYISKPAEESASTNESANTDEPNKPENEAPKDSQENDTIENVLKEKCIDAEACDTLAKNPKYEKYKSEIEALKGCYSAKSDSALNACTKYLQNADYKIFKDAVVDIYCDKDSVCFEKCGKSLKCQDYIELLNDFDKIKDNFDKKKSELIDSHIKEVKAYIKCDDKNDATALKYCEEYLSNENFKKFRESVVSKQAEHKKTEGK